MTSKTKTADAVEIEQPIAEPAVSKGEVVHIAAPRLPYHELLQDRFGVDKAGWRVLIDAIFPNARTFDAVLMALGYCKARKLDVFKRPVHIVPMWSSAAGRMIETCWPSISELRTTAFRTGQYAGMEAPEFGPLIERTFKGKSTKGKTSGQTREVSLQFPEWCRITIVRSLSGKERRFVGPMVYWREAYAKWSDTDVPNDMWAHRTVGQLEKCAEAAALRRAFPEEIGNELTAEEMWGQQLTDPGAAAKDITPRDNAPPSPDADAFDPDQWLKDLEGALSGAEDMTALAEAQESVMNPMKGKVADATWRLAEQAVIANLKRIEQDADKPAAGTILDAG